MLQRLARLLAPPVCLVCSAEGQLVCARCWHGSFQSAPEECIGCRGHSPGGQTCKSCLNRIALQGVMAGGSYEGVLRELIGRLKYHHQREAAQVMAKLLVPHLERNRFDVITAVPVVNARRRQRGYNQAELIARHVAKGLALPYRRLVVRVRATQQVGKSRNERLSHVAGAFACKGPIKGSRVLLIDDVITTGATLNECARVLRVAGATYVWGTMAARD